MYAGTMYAQVQVITLRHCLGAFISRSSHHQGP